MLLLVRESFQGLKRKLEVWKEASEPKGLTVNVKKTKLINNS